MYPYWLHILTSFNVVFIYIADQTPGEGGGGPTGVGFFMLQSGGTDRIILTPNDNLTQANGDNIQLSLGTCFNEMLLSGGTDNILLSGGTDKLLITGYCSNFIILSSRRLMVSG